MESIEILPLVLSTTQPIVMDASTAVAGPVAPPGGSDVSLLIGPVLLGYMLSYFLFGILCVQIYLYHIAFPRDSIWLKLYVGLVFCLEVVLTILAGFDAWWSNVSGFGDLSHMAEQGNPTSAAEVPIFGLIGIMIHGFYSWRIVKLTSSWYIVVLIMVSSLAHFALAIYIGAMHGVNNGELGKWGEISQQFTAMFATGVAADILITFTLVFVLSRALQKTAFRDTSTMLQRLIVFSVETALITSCWATAQLILFHYRERTGVYFLFCFYVLPRLYSITFMATLNARMHVHGAAPERNTTPGVGFATQHTILWQDLEAQSLSSSCVSGQVETHEMANGVLKPRNGDTSGSQRRERSSSVFDVKNVRDSHSVLSEPGEPHN